jgi:hypothetical protein
VHVEGFISDAAGARVSHGARGRPTPSPRSSHGTAPAELAAAILDGSAGGVEEIFPDGMARQLGQLWLSSPKELEGQFAAM